MSVIGGSCSKCGAPFWVPEVWHGIVPPSPTPTCACWNTPQSTTNTVTFEDDPIQRDFAACHDRIATLEGALEAIVSRLSAFGLHVDQRDKGTILELARSALARPGAGKDGGA